MAVRRSRHNKTRRDTWRTLHYNGVTYPNYIISIDGRIKHVYSGEDLKPYRSGSNGRYYDMVTVYGKNGKQKTHVRIPRAMVETWHEIQLEPGFDVHHINGDHEDNRLENLLYLERTEHQKLHGNLKRWQENV